MKKKLIALMMILVMVLSLGLLTGCGGNDQESETDGTDTLVVGLDDSFRLWDLEMRKVIL